MIQRMKTLNKKRKFRKELKLQSRLALSAAVGFLIAFAWKDFVLILVEDSINTLATIAPPPLSKLAAAIFMTLFGAIIIIISSKILK